MLAVCKSYNCSNLVDPSNNDAIHASFETTNTVKVVVKGSHIDLFANGVKVGSCDDSSLAAGGVGLVAGSDVESVFTKLVIKRA